MDLGKERGQAPMIASEHKLACILEFCNKQYTLLLEQHEQQYAARQNMPHLVRTSALRS